MQFKSWQESRRYFLTTFVAGVYGHATGASALISTAHASETARTSMQLTHLIDALRLIGKPVCLSAAERLLSVSTPGTGIHLHLRRARLNESDAKILSEGIRRASVDEQLLLRSFSASFNPELADKGVIALANVFPESMSELGLVNCSIGDSGGRAILEWAESATNLSMLCVEGNRFSSNMQLQFKNLAIQRRQILVVV
ncbi:MAG: hypothetical protein AB8B64_05045 [Granulosicoccus sp.]